MTTIYLHFHDSRTLPDGVTESRRVVGGWLVGGRWAVCGGRLRGERGLRVVVGRRVRSGERVRRGVLHHLLVDELLPLIHCVLALVHRVVVRRRRRLRTSTHFSAYRMHSYVNKHYIHVDHTNSSTYSLS